MRIDFSETKDTVGSTEGRHTLTIVKAEEKKSKNGTWMLVLDMHDEEEGYVRDQVCLEGPGAFRAKQFFAAAGVEKEVAETMEAADFIGYTLEADIVIEEYEDKEYSKVKKYI